MISPAEHGLRDKFEPVQGDPHLAARTELACAMDLEFGPDRDRVDADTIRRHMLLAAPYIRHLRDTLGDKAFESHWGSAAQLERKYLG